MSDPREALLRLVYAHEEALVHGVTGCWACPDRALESHGDFAEHVAELIAREFLVVPRSAVIGTEYAIERRNDSRGLWRYRAGDEADARAQSAARQVAYAKTYPVSRPILPWSPIPLGEVPDAG